MSPMKLPPEMPRFEVDRGSTPATGTAAVAPPPWVDHELAQFITVPLSTPGTYTRYCAVLEPLRMRPRLSELAMVPVGAATTVLPSHPEMLSVMLSRRLRESTL